METPIIPVRLTLVSTSRDENGESDQPVRVMTTGQLQKSASGYVLRYEESNANEATGEVTISPVTLSMRPGRVEMSRSGEFCTTMIFVKDTRFEGVYHTPYGDMGLALFTTLVHTRLAEDKGSVRLEYQIDMHGNYSTTQIISLEYTADRPC